jgi:ribosome-associated toxin RatA of RatAB toxin-antitoxin module
LKNWHKKASKVSFKSRERFVTKKIIAIEVREVDQKIQNSKFKVQHGNWTIGGTGLLRMK